MILWKATLRPHQLELGASFVVYALSETSEGAMKAAKRQGDRILHERMRRPGDLDGIVIESRCDFERLERLSSDNNLIWDAAPHYPYLAGRGQYELQGRDGDYLSLWQVELSPSKPQMAMEMQVNVVAGDIQTALAYAKQVAEAEFAHFEDNGVQYTPTSATPLASYVQVATGGA